MTAKVKKLDDLCIKDISPKNEHNKEIDVTMQKEKLIEKIKMITINIKNIFGIDIPDFIHDNNIQCNKSYDLFLKVYTHMMFENIKLYKFIYDKNKLEQYNDYNIFISDKLTYNFNIICFGKSLYYHIRYIYFILYDLLSQNSKKDNEIYNIILFCDQDTFNLYKNNSITLATYKHKRENYDNSKKVWNEFKTKFVTFSNLLNSLYPLDKKDIFIDCLYELEKLKLFNVNILFCVSDNYLMKGIGAKRSLMNYFHYKITKNINNEDKKNNYMCMNLDDNITMVGNFNKDCTGRGEAKKMSDKYTYDIPSKLINCDNISIYSLYKKLADDWQIKDKLKEMNIIGIQKGGGTQDDKLCLESDDLKKLYCAKPSYSVYKLTLQKPYKIYENNYQYNPFFTRFLEDMVFNAINKNYIQKSKYYFLRFGHTKPKNNDDIDFDDFFNDHLFESYDDKIKSIEGIEQIYLMNIHYLYYYSNLISSSTVYEKLIDDEFKNFIGNDGDTDDAKTYQKYNKGLTMNFTKYVSIIMSMSNSKYVHYGLIVMMLYLLLKSNIDKNIFPKYEEIHKYVCDSVKYKDKFTEELQISDMGFNEKYNDMISMDNIQNNTNASQYLQDITTINDIAKISICKKDREKCTENYINTIKNILLDFGLYKIKNKIGYLDFDIDNHNLEFIDFEYKLLNHLFNFDEHDILINKNFLEKTKKITNYIKNRVNDIKIYTKTMKNPYIRKNIITSVNFCRYCLNDDGRNDILKYKTKKTFRQKYLKYKYKYLKIKNEINYD